MFFSISKLNIIFDLEKRIKEQKNCSEDNNWENIVNEFEQVDEFKLILRIICKNI